MVSFVIGAFVDDTGAAAVAAVPASYLKTLLDDVVDVTDDGVGDADTDATEPVSLVVLPRFLFANSYISPKIPANVLRKFFIVSSASSTTEL